MATNCVVRIYDKTADCHLVSLYKHASGQPNQFGQRLADFLISFEDLLPSRRGAWQMGRHAVGAGCLAAQLIKHFKIIPGVFYIAPAHFSPEIIYNVYGKDEEPVLLGCSYYGEQVFEGLPEDFDGDEIMNRQHGALMEKD